MEKAMIKDLKKNDRFIFNGKVYTVTKKYKNDDSPLKAALSGSEKHWSGLDELFHYDELEIGKL